MPIEAGSTILFTGDSITDCGRARPFGDSAADSPGGGYVSLIDWLLASGGESPAMRLINTGISGNTVRDLATRWDEDVLEFQPDWVSVMIGINDVWRQFDSDPAIVKPVTLDEYASTLFRLLERTRPRTKGIVVMLPFFVVAERNDGANGGQSAGAMRAMRDQYAEAAAAAARAVGGVIVDTQAAFERALRLRSAARLAPDGVHPTGLGHMVLARAWLHAVGYRL